MGFPAPRVPLATANPEILGRAFLVMERRPGRPLLAAPFLGIGRLLVETQLRLHALDPDAFLRALEREVPGSGALVTLDGHLRQLEARIDRLALDGLRSAMRWLQDHRPPPGGPRAICHGDFHPQNLLADRGEVTAVLDWPHVLVAEPAYDVAATRAILGLTPLEVLPMRASLRWLMEASRGLLLARYLREYQRRRPLAATALAYGEALACMRGLVRAAESRRAVFGEPAAPANPLDASSFGDRLAARFAALTGIQPRLPARGAPPHQRGRARFPRHRSTSSELTAGTLRDRRRVLVVGNAGAGKTTFAMQLARIIGLPLIQLDRHYWQPGWTPRPEDIWNRHMVELIGPDSWIMDGNYVSSLAMRLGRCDAVVFFDLPRSTCLWAVLRRVVVHQLARRPDLPDGCPETVDWEFLRWIWTFPAQARPRIVDALERVRDDVMVVRITRRAHARAVLAGTARALPKTE